MTPLLPIKPLKISKRTLHSETNLALSNIESPDFEASSFSSHSLVDLGEEETYSTNDFLLDSSMKVSIAKYLIRLDSTFFEKI